MGPAAAALAPPSAPTVSFNDTGRYFHPVFVHMHRDLARGELSLWNPYQMAGMPFIATQQAGQLADRAFKLRSSPTSEYGSYGKSLRGPRSGKFRLFSWNSRARHLRDIAFSDRLEKEDQRRGNKMRANDRPVRVRAVWTGFAVEGKGFYVWDEDPQVAMDSANELERGNVTRARASCVLLIPVQGFGSTEALDA